MPTEFRIVGEVTAIETIAVGRGVRQRRVLNRRFGAGRWRKKKGLATVQLPDGTERRAEVHWYEAHGIGRRGFKIKRYTHG